MGEAMPAKVFTAYQCTGCDKIHKDEWSAEECCPRETPEVDAWECDNCESLNHADDDECDECGESRDAAGRVFGSKGPGDCECCGSSNVRIWRSVTRVNDTWGCVDCGAFLGMVYSGRSEEAKAFLSAYPKMAVVL
jgi:hypothetical protein